MNPFKAYDIRGEFPAEINEKFAFALGRALAREFGAARAIVGHDCRLSSPALARGALAGLAAENCEAAFYGPCCTEEIYYAAQKRPFDLGIMITGSHNPAGENGFKIVRAGAAPVSGDSGLKNVEKRVEAFLREEAAKPATPQYKAVGEELRREYARWLADYAGAGKIAPGSIKIAAECGNGCAGLLLRELAPHLPFELAIVNGEPDGAFPNGVPNPLLPEKREAAAQAVREHNADFGIAFDGDADRCFFYDHAGRFIEGYYLVGLLAQRMLSREPHSKIIHDPRLYWNTRELVEQAGGEPIRAKTGHAFIKERMRRENASYGGEMSAHHYFRDFGYCDSGMLPWLLMASLITESGKSLAELVDERIGLFPCSGEINRKIVNPDAAIGRAREKYARDALLIEEIDGLNMEFSDWRFSLRKSNTEPLLRLNVESRGDAALMRRKTAELLALTEE